MLFLDVCYITLLVFISRAACFDVDDLMDCSKLWHLFPPRKTKEKIKKYNFSAFFFLFPRSWNDIFLGEMVGVDAIVSGKENYTPVIVCIIYPYLFPQGFFPLVSCQLFALSWTILAPHNLKWSCTFTFQLMTLSWILQGCSIRSRTIKIRSSACHDLIHNKQSHCLRF